MLQAIAFCVDERNQVATFESASLVRVYQKCLGTWELPGEPTELAELVWNEEAV